MSILRYPVLSEPFPGAGGFHTCSGIQTVLSLSKTIQKNINATPHRQPPLPIQSSISIGMLSNGPEPLILKKLSQPLKAINSNCLNRPNNGETSIIKAFRQSML